MKNREFSEEKFKAAWNATYSIVPDEEVERSWKIFRNRLKSSTKRGYIKVRLAAAMLLLLFTSNLFIEIIDPTITVRNCSQLDKEVTLPDGSLVLLKKDAEIQYKEKFKKFRGVKLKGAAFFNVKKNNSQEFKVFTKSTITRVVGTSFSVIEKERSENVEIFLYTGRVVISGSDKNGCWSLVPGESLKYSKGIGSIKNFNINLSFESGNKFIDVDNLQVEELFDFLKKRYGYKFLENSYTRDQTVTLRINKKDSLKQILKLLTTINNTYYEINQNTKEIQIFNK